MRLDTDSYYDGGIDRHEQPAEPGEPDFFEARGIVAVEIEPEDTVLDAETRATTAGAATATAPDFSGISAYCEWESEAQRIVMGDLAASISAMRFARAINDLRGCPKMSRHHGATEGGGILPAAPGECES